MQNCIHTNCNYKVHANGKHCALHVEKSEFYTDQRSGLLHDFYISLASYLCDSISDLIYTDEDIDLRKKEVFSSLEKREKPAFTQFLEIAPKFDSIRFPDRKSQYLDRDDYAIILNYFSGLWFDHCHFYTSDIGVKKSEVFFDDCTFHDYWYLNNLSPLENVRGVIYQYCQFKESVSSSGHDGEKVKIESPQFSNCIFLKSLGLEKTIFLSDLFRNETEYDKTMYDCNQATISIESCEFLSKFSINYYILHKFSCENSTFRKFEFKNNIIDNFYISDCNFFEVSDFYKTSFNNFYAHKSVFEKFTGFENCLFGKPKGSSTSIFKYTTFFSFINFRNTIFYSGIDIENINLEKSANFLGVDIKSENTNRESYRIIKDSFDFIGNKLEANYFFAKEMNEYRKELKIRKGKGSEKFIFNLNYYISNYGQSYLLPLLYILIFSILYSFTIFAYEEMWLNKFFPFQSDFITSVSTFLNDFAKNIIPVKSLLKDGMEFISLLFNLIFSILIWQTIVAVKRHTKR